LRTQGEAAPRTGSFASLVITASRKREILVGSLQSAILRQRLACLKPMRVLGRKQYENCAVYSIQVPHWLRVTEIARVSYLGPLRAARAVADRLRGAAGLVSRRPVCGISRMRPGPLVLLSWLQLHTSCAYEREPGRSGEDCVSRVSAGWIVKSSRLMRRQESSRYASSADRRAGRAAQGKPLRAREVAAANRGALSLW
jgi:hypothetical protein